eukprot:6210177-Pleurochrysis_carterae.AAC.1
MNSPTLSLCFRLVLKEVYGLETSVVVDEDEQVLEPCVLRPHEGTRDVDVDEAAGIRRLVQCRVMRVSGCVGFSASRTALEVAVSQRKWSVRGDVRENPQASGTSA